jgi:hypothetical protein
VRDGISTEEGKRQKGEVNPTLLIKKVAEPLASELAARESYASQAECDKTRGSGLGCG